MPDGEVGAAERTALAVHQRVLQRSLVHSVHEVERAWPELDGVVVLAVVIGAGHGGEGEEHGHRGSQCGREQCFTHESLLELALLELAPPCATLRRRSYEAGMKAR